MTNPQGTAWETDIVERFRMWGIPAIRLVKQSQKDEADVLVGQSSPISSWAFGALLWKRIVKGKGKNRQPLGERHVVVLTLDDFIELLSQVPDDTKYSVWVQAKWTERLSVTKVLAGLNDWVRMKAPR